MKPPTERPLLVTGSLVNPILRGEKRVTRRILKLPRGVPTDTLAELVGWRPERLSGAFGQPSSGHWEGVLPAGPDDFNPDAVFPDGPATYLVRPPCAVGDVLWVRETWSHTGDGVWSPRDALHAMNGRFIYRATDPAPCAGCWFPSIHMPRKAARIFLRVEDVRVERVQDITEEDARAEGATNGRNGWFFADPPESVAAFPTAREAFADLWDSLAPAGSKWADSPWVWRIGFALVKP